MKQEEINKKEYLLLSCQTRAILLGSVLGDGSVKIAKTNKNANFQEKHSIKQKEYLMWKRDVIFQDLSASEKDLSFTTDTATTASSTASGQRVDKIHYASARLPSLTHLGTLIHKGSIQGKIKIRRT